jgi:hypothetical protein
MDTEYWYFTFIGKQHSLANRYIKVNGTYDEARTKVFNAIGDKWGFQYSEDTMVFSDFYFELTEISLDELVSNPELLEIGEYHD